jgi:hypothetical protein
MKRTILVLIIVAVAAVMAVKLPGKKERTQSRPAPLTSSSAVSTQGRLILYLFYDQVDQEPVRARFMPMWIGLRESWLESSKCGGWMLIVR